MDNKEESTNDKKKMKWNEHLACGWPLVLVLIGGALGGACGGAAYFLNVKIFAKDIPKKKKYIYMFLAGLGAFVAYFLVVVILALIFPELFAE